MKNQDKFERMVEKAKYGNGLDGWFFYPEHVVRLLRLQHAAYVRMVQNEKLSGETDEAVDIGYNQACEDILNQFENYKR